MLDFIVMEMSKVNRVKGCMTDNLDLAFIYKNPLHSIWKHIKEKEGTSQPTRKNFVMIIFAISKYAKELIIWGFHWNKSKGQLNVDFGEKTASAMTKNSLDSIVNGNILPAMVLFRDWVVHTCNPRFGKG